MQSSKAQFINGTGRTVLLIDPRVDGYRTLLRSIGRSRPIETHVVAADRDALPQIAAIVAGGGKVDALHILAHGAPGRLALGRDGLDLAALDRDPEAVATIRMGLRGGELRLIACAAGAGEAGRAFVAALSLAFRAAVVASEGLIGRGWDGGADVAAVPQGASLRQDLLIAKRELGAYPAHLMTNYNVTEIAGTGSFTDVWESENPTDGDTIYFNSAVTGTIDLSDVVTIRSSAAHYLAADNAITIDDAAGGGISVNSGRFFTWGRADVEFLPVTISANVSGSGGFAVIGSGPVVLSGTNSFSGGMSVTSGGTLSLTGTGAFGSGTITLNNGTLAITGATNTANAMSIGANGGTIDNSAFTTLTGTISDDSNGYSLTKNGTGDLTLTGVSANFTGTFNVTAGAFKLNAAGADSALAKATLNVTTSSSVSIQSAETIGGLKGTSNVSITDGDLTIDQSADTTYEGSITGTNGVAKTGAGTLTLSGANSYSGIYNPSSTGTLVSGGTLNITGSLANTNLLRVTSGGTLTGSGSVGGGVDLRNGATFGRSGTVDGTFTVGGDTTIGEAGGATTTFHVDVKTDGNGGYTYDSMKGDATFTLADATLTVVTDGSTSVGDVLTLIDDTGINTISGTFSGLAEGATFTSGSTTFKISYVGGSGNDVTITHMAAPASGGGGGGGGSTESFTSSQTTTSSSGGTTVATTTLTNRSGGSGSAAIVQNTSNNGNLVTATLPTSVSLTSEGPGTAQSGTQALTTLSGAISARNSSGNAALQGGAQTFLTNLGATTTLDIRTIIPSFNAANTSSDPIVITGSAQSGQSEAFVIDMRSLQGKALQLNNIEFASIIGNATVTGGSGNNFAVGDDGNQFISLGEGDDTLYGGAGDDTIGSADGNDLLFGDQGYDTVNGGSGDDTTWGGLDNDVVYGNTGNDVVYGNQYNDTLYGGQDADTVYGGQDDDIVYGNLGADLLYGNLGADTLYGGDGADTVNGSEGADLVYGNAGGDHLSGGAGDDTLFGGAGQDTFSVGSGDGADIISDFSVADGDRIEIAADLNGTTIDSLTDLQVVATDFAGNVIFDLGDGNSLTLIGVQTADLQSDWFGFI